MPVDGPSILKDKMDSAIVQSSQSEDSAGSKKKDAFLPVNKTFPSVSVQPSEHHQCEELSKSSCQETSKKSWLSERRGQIIALWNSIDQSLRDVITLVASILLILLLVGGFLAMILLIVFYLEDYAWALRFVYTVYSIAAPVTDAYRLFVVESKSPHAQSKPKGPKTNNDSNKTDSLSPNDVTTPLKDASENFQPKKVVTGNTGSTPLEENPITPLPEMHPYLSRFIVCCTYTSWVVLAGLLLCRIPVLLIMAIVYEDLVAFFSKIENCVKSIKNIIMKSLKRVWPSFRDETSLVFTVKERVLIAFDLIFATVCFSSALLYDNDFPRFCLYFANFTYKGLFILCLKYYPFVDYKKAAFENANTTFVGTD